MREFACIMKNTTSLTIKYYTLSSLNTYTLYSLSILYRLWSQLYLQEERKEWTGQPCHNPCRVWYWAKGNEKNREDPRIPTDNDIVHAKHLEMSTQAVQKLRQNTGVPNAKLTIPRFHAGRTDWWVSIHI